MIKKILGILLITSLVCSPVFAERITLQDGNGNEVGTAGNPLVVSGGGSVSDDAYGAGWNGVTTVAPSKNAVRDKIESMPSESNSYTGYNVTNFPYPTGWVTQLTASAGNTVAMGYDAITTGAADFGASGTEFHVLTYSHKNRIRQVGSLTQVKFYTPSKPAQLTAFYIEVWRATDPDNPTSFTRISQEDVLASITAATTNTVTLASPVSVQEGDFIGYGYTASSDPGNFLDSITGIAASSYTTTSTPSASGYAWKSQTSVTNILPMQGYVGTAPLIVFVGDSIMSGVASSGSYNRSFIEAEDKTLSTHKVEYYVQKALSANGGISGITYQNMGVGGQPLTTIRARITADVVNLTPKICVINGGINGSTTGLSSTSTYEYISEWQKILDLLEAANIVTFVESIMPWESTSTADARRIDEINERIKALCRTRYKGVFFVDQGITLGKFRSGGDAGNRWDWNDLYDSGDGLHPNAAGHIARSKNIIQVMNEASRNQFRNSPPIQSNDRAWMALAQIRGLLTAPKLLIPFLEDPQVSSTTLDFSGNANTATYSGILYSERFNVGAGFMVDGATSNSLTIPDSTTLTFGDGSNDSAFSVFGIFQLTNQASEQTIIAKYTPKTAATKREWLVAVDSSEKLRLDIWDESAAVASSRLTDAALTVLADSITGTIHTFCITYSGVGGATAGNGITIYVDGALVASTATNNGSYVAMENTTQIVTIGTSRSTADAGTNWFLSDLGLVGISGEVISANTAYTLDKLLRSMYGLEGQ